MTSRPPSRTAGPPGAVGARPEVLRRGTYIMQCRKRTSWDSRGANGIWRAQRRGEGIIWDGHEGVCLLLPVVVWADPWAGQWADIISRTTYHHLPIMVVEGCPTDRRHCFPPRDRSSRPGPSAAAVPAVAEDLLLLLLLPVAISEVVTCTQLPAVLVVGGDIPCAI